MKYGLLGEKLSHSYSKIIHDKIGLYHYDLIPIAKENLDGFLTSRDFSGLNVTIPYKRAVFNYCDVVDPEAAAIGSINILYFKDGLLHGGNTDYFGLSYAMERAGISMSGKKVLLLGNGGTAKTAAALAKDQGAQAVWTAMRHPTGVGEVSYDNPPTDAEIVLNTTPVGMYPNNLNTLIHLEDFPNCQGVVDVIYNPFSTLLVQNAATLGIPATGGLPMLIAQAVSSASFFTGRQDLMAMIEPILHQLTLELQNIVLIGMPGSGKSHLGKLLARQLHRTFVDLDEEVEKIAGRSIPKIFADQGEEAFRNLETEVALEYGKKNRLVIAAGGGIVQRRLNIMGLKQNGLLVYVDRPLESLSTHGRPLSAGGIEALVQLYSARKPLYEKYRDITLPNNQSIEGALAILTGMLEKL